MSKKDEALKMALKTLEKMGRVMKQSPDTEKAIVAIRKALAEHIEQHLEMVEQSTCKQALQVEQPAQDNTYNYVKSLAEAIFKQHFASDEHYASGRIVWGVNDTVIGILTQIDNMVADMVRRPARQDSTCSNSRGSTKGFMKTKHTPGPWSLDIGITGKIEVVATQPMRFNSISAGTPVICDVWQHPEIEDFPGHANARLIAAAPELLTQLRNMVTCFERFEDTHTALVMDDARAAIEAAHGIKGDA